jgi:hypothetical protein
MKADTQLLSMCRKAATAGSDRCELAGGRLRAIVIRSPASGSASIDRVSVALWNLGANRLLCVAHFADGRLRSFRPV